MKVPTVGSRIKVRTSYSQGPAMIPPQPAFHEYEGEVLTPYKWLSDREFCMSGNTEWPIRVISMGLVEDIQLISGEFKEVNTGVQSFEVEGSKGKKYTVTRLQTGWSCTCPGFQFRKSCKHVVEMSKEPA